MSWIDDVEEAHKENTKHGDWVYAIEIDRLLSLARAAEKAVELLATGCGGSSKAKEAHDILKEKLEG